MIYAGVFFCYNKDDVKNRMVRQHSLRRYVMRAFLVDFENVHSTGLTGVESLLPTDKVIIFYSNKSDVLSFDIHRRIMKSTAVIEYYKIRRGGKNSLDFQLSSLLGWLIAKEEFNYIAVISNDSGFDFLKDFWENCPIETSVKLARHRTLQEADQSYRNNSIKSKGILVAESSKTNDEAADNSLANDEFPLDKALTATDEKENDSAQSAALHETGVEWAENEITDSAVLTKPSHNNEVLAEEVAENQIEAASASGKELLSLQGLRIAAALPQIVYIETEEEQRKNIGNHLMQSENRQDFYRWMIKEFGQKKGLQLYSVIKPEYNRLKELL